MSSDFSINLHSMHDKVSFFYSLHTLLYLGLDCVQQASS